MAVQEAVNFPLSEELKAKLKEEFSGDAGLLRLIEGEAPILGQSLLEFYKRINRTYSPYDIRSVFTLPLNNPVVEEATRIIRVERLVQEWLVEADKPFATPAVFKQHFAEFFPNAESDWQHWFDEHPDIVNGQLMIAHDTLKSGHTTLGVEPRGPVHSLEHPATAVEILLRDWEHILSENFERRRQVEAIKIELGLY